MEIAIFILSSIIFSALLLGAFYLGYKFRDSKKEEGAIKVDDDNKDQINQILKWINYRG